MSQHLHELVRLLVHKLVHRTVRASRHTLLGHELVHLCHNRQQRHSRLKDKHLSVLRHISRPRTLVDHLVLARGFQTAHESSSSTAAAAT